MTDQEVVIHALTTGPSQHIAFSFPATAGGTVTVNSTTFQRVATAIRGGQITLVITNSFPAGVGAEYLPTTYASRPGIAANTMRVRPQISRLYTAGLLHEAVHASFDLVRSAGVNALNQEAAAYIAEYIYYRRTGVAARRVADGIRNAARPIAEAVIRGQAITGAQITALTAAISGHPVYTNIPAGSYPNDG